LVDRGRPEFMPVSPSIPPAIMVSEPGSFAYNTLAQRLPHLCYRIIAENEFSPQIVSRLTALAEALPQAEITPVQDEFAQATDLADWKHYLAPYAGQRWIDLPWYFAEAYFYRKVLQAIDYFRTGIDPYLQQKQLGIETAIGSIRNLSAQVNQIQAQWDVTSCVALVYVALWGNRVDLSLFPADSGSHWEIEASNESENLLVDDTAQLVNWIETHPGARIDFIVDNTGFELVSDLALADYLLTSQIAKEIRLHVKPAPIFVSDAMTKDVHSTVSRLMNDPDDEVKLLAVRLKNHLEKNRLQLHTHPFWTTPLVFWEIPEDLRQTLKTARLVIVKGDANYRRLLGDRHWDFTTPFAEIVHYFPAPVVALRTLKAELACGLQPKQIDCLNAVDAHWLTNGRRGVIQFALPNFM